MRTIRKRDADFADYVTQMDADQKTFQICAKLRCEACAHLRPIC
jgi:hypothetical protein